MILTPLISADVIASKIADVAKQIDRDFSGKSLILIFILKGSVCLVADLMRQLKTPLELEAVRASSYGLLGTTPGQLQIQGLESLNIAHKDILLVDDIYDTGRTLNAIAEQLKNRGATSVKTLVLLRKKSSPAKRPDYVLFEIGDEFVVGYGLDYKEQYRSLPGIFQIKVNT